MTDLMDPMTFRRGPAMPNRFMLAPLTNQQSHPDGTLSDEELNWLAMRAEGGFGLVMTAAAMVAPVGRGFAGQIGFQDDSCLPGLTRLAAAIHRHGALCAAQLHHAGARADLKGTGLQPVAPSDEKASGSRAMTGAEIEATIEDFAKAAERAQQAGFDGVELHGAHGYLLAQFLSPEFNRREDRYGGSLENRARLIRDVIAEVRKRCRPDFQLGLRLSGERMGMRLGEVRTLAGELMAEGALDYIDMSLWDVFKEPEEAEFKGRPLLEWFTDLDRHGTRLGVAGNIRSGATARACLETGADYVLIGRAAIVNHDFPRRVAQEADFTMPPLPVTREHLAREGVSPAFVGYLSNFPGFVEPA